jgi:hypothetical protein
MDPTYKLYRCLKISRHVGVAVLPDISRCIVDGACLTKQECYDTELPEAIPVIMAMQMGCDPRIVEHLDQQTLKCSFAATR